MTALLGALAGTVTGVLSGLGMGGGTVLMIYMVTAGGLAQHTAQGINLLYFLPCSAAALWGHFKNGQVEWRMAIPAVAAGLPAAFLCAQLAQHMDGGWLRKIFGVGVIIVGIRELRGK